MCGSGLSRLAALGPVVVFLTWCLAGTMCTAQTVWTEDFEGFSLGDLPAQDATWTASADVGLDTSSVDVVSGQELKIYAAAPSGVGQVGNYAFKDLSSLGITGNTVTFSFTMLHAFAGAYAGKWAGTGYVSSSKGTMFSIEMYDLGGTAYINGFAVAFPAGSTYHDYVLEIDFELDTITVTIDTNDYGSYALMGT